MPKEPKDLRIPIMMTATEVEAIDEWRYANKIATRAEAIRRLCQIGLSSADLLSARLGDSLNQIAMAALAIEASADGTVPKAEIPNFLDQILEAVEKLNWPTQRLERTARSAERADNIAEIIDASEAVRKATDEARRRLAGRTVPNTLKSEARMRNSVRIHAALQRWIEAHPDPKPSVTDARDQALLYWLVAKRLLPDGTDRRDTEGPD